MPTRVLDWFNNRQRWVQVGIVTGGINLLGQLVLRLAVLAHNADLISISSIPVFALRFIIYPVYTTGFLFVWGSGTPPFPFSSSFLVALVELGVWALFGFVIGFLIMIVGRNSNAR